ncbi:hypothetical protein M0R89_16845 [Halorussus limi]|uniref:Uncharacterized protein n=1 Tax=Halorussus limi TaxID=2938695 RepID=A0A8U0HTW8_9EURY|nr:hypothetical protein [Halorussus limi]UPV74193.1 hypothetical protein M0R89_16845 [Halorussus limi]
MTRPDRHTQTRDDSTTDQTADDTPMRDVSHTHPHAARGTVNRPFQRGPVVAADGGERDAVSRTSEDERSESSESEREARDADAREEDDEESRADRMKDVAHTPPYGEGADRVFERGGEREPVESEE